MPNRFRFIGARPEPIGIPPRDLSNEFTILDKTMCEDYNLNSHGFIRNDINVLLEANSMQEMQYVAQKFQERKTQDLYKDASDEDILKTIKPRLMQSPAEMESFLKYVDSVISELGDEAKKAAETQKEGSIEFNPNDEPNEKV